MESFIERAAIHWDIDNGILTVSGEGKLPDRISEDTYDPEWDDLKNDTTELCIADGITEIGISAFSGWNHLEKVTLPSSLKRIHAYAFRDCTALEVIECGGREFRYVYDHISLELERIVFGMESFHNTPWSRKEFGDFYIRGAYLFAAFPGGERDLVVPEGVRVLKLFSMNHLELNSLVLPKSLKHIENFAFSDSVVEEPVAMPESVDQLDEYALADCAIFWKCNELLDEKLREYAKSPKEKRSRFPRKRKRYSVVLESRKKYDKFKKMVVKDRIKSLHGSLDSCILDESLDYMESLLKKIHRGCAMIHVECSDNVVESIHSYAWKDWIGEIQGQWSAPVRTADDGVMPKSDGMAYFTTSEFEHFWRSIGPWDEWFRAEDAGLCSQYDLLKVWLTLHPDIRVRSENDYESQDSEKRAG